MNPFDPMPTIKSILGMTMAQDIEQSIMLAQLDDFEAPQCEGRGHTKDTEHHAGAAGFLMNTPCGHSDGYRCTPFVKWLLSPGHIICSRCKLKYESTELIVLPIGGQK